MSIQDRYQAYAAAFEESYDDDDWSRIAEFFTEDDPVAQDASLLLDRIVRQGRAFGIHVILGSQTLGGAYTLARATLGQMVIRIALQCNEADAFLIMDDDNPAPRLLSRPGEGIYNDNAGALEANGPFQTVWIGEEERDAWLDKVSEVAKEKVMGELGEDLAAREADGADGKPEVFVLIRLRSHWCCL